METTAGLKRDRAAGPWLAQPERGTVLGIRLLVGLTRVLGRGFGRLLLHPIALWYALFGAEARRASRAFLQAVHGREARFGEVYQHVLRFCQVALDRLFLLQGRLEPFEFETHGSQLLTELRARGRGAILLGAHLGSFEAMRALSRHEDLRLNVLVHFENARKINGVLRALAPEGMTGIIAIDPGDPSFVLEVRERLEAGELVAILGDRVGLGERSVTVPFLGRPARFPVGPYLLAASLGCPVYLTFGLHVPPNRYRLSCEPLFEELELPRKDRDAALEQAVRRYAERLEHHARLAPDNWFNFYDFWRTDGQ